MSDVVGGAHVDYTRSALDRWQWTFNKTLAGFLSQFLGVFIAFALGQLWILAMSVRRAAKKYHAAHSQQWPSAQGPTQGPPQTQAQALTQAQAPTSDEFELTSLAAVVFSNLRKAWSAIQPEIQLPNQTPPRRDWKESLQSFSRASFAFVLLAGCIALATVANGINGNSKVLLLSPNCGVYQPPAKDTFQATSIFETRAQSDAAEYARLCYGDGGSRFETCNKFIRQTIDYKTFDNQTCPFADGMCYLGKNGSITFSTGFTPASALGINAGPELQFERQTTCAPINMNDTFVKLHNETLSRKQTGYVFTYHYGYEGINGSISYQTFTYGDFFEKTPSYLVNAIATIRDGPDNGEQSWLPIDQLYTPYGTVLTLLFILPGKIYFSNYSTDPIFPATKETDLKTPYTNLTTWMYIEGYARVLACVDRARWRNLAESEQWHENNDPPSKDSPIGKEWLLWASLRQSNTYQTISKKLGAALDATSLISQYLSLPLHKEQWKVEAKHLFEISLARAAFEVEYVMRGIYSGYPGYIKAYTPTINRRICSSNYLAIDPDYSNVHGTWYVIALVVSLIILFLSVPLDQDLLWERLCGDRSGRWSYLFVSSLSDFFRGIPATIRKLWNSISWTNLGHEILKFSRNVVNAISQIPTAIGRWLKAGISFLSSYISP